MVDNRYARLKMKMLLLVVAGTIIAGAGGLFVLDVMIDGFLQDPFARFFVWVSTNLFDKSTETALELYQIYIRNNKQELVTLGMGVLMLVAFYIAMGRFTTWLDEISSATRKLVNETGEEVHLPKELRPLEEDLNAIRCQLKTREEETRESERRKSDLIAFLAHDLKTPLTSVVGYLTLLRDEPGLDQIQRGKFTGVALEKAQRLEELLGEFFDITRMELQSSQEHMERIHLSVLLEQLTDEFYPLFAEKGLHCRSGIEQNLIVQGAPEKLARVFDNVLRNAVCYSTEGGTVEIAAIQERKNVEIVIRNEGLEIPEGELANIFRQFYRLDAARSTRTGGAGLGLAIAKEIIEFHGGGIRAESDGRLTSFVITLPLSGEAEENGTAMRQQALA